MEHQLQKLDTIFEPDTFFELHSTWVIHIISVTGMFLPYRMHKYYSE